MKTLCLVLGLSLFTLGCDRGGSGGMDTEPNSPSAETTPAAPEGGGGLSGSGPVGGPGPTGTGITP